MVAEADLASILDHHAIRGGSEVTSRAGEDRSLTQGTAGWAALGGPTPASEGQTDAEHHAEREPEEAR